MSLLLWTTVTLVVAEALGVLSGLVELTAVAVILGVVGSALLCVVGVGTAVALGRYRMGRDAGLPGPVAAEHGLAAVLPARFSRFLVLQIRVIGALRAPRPVSTGGGRAGTPRIAASDAEFGYGEQLRPYLRVALGLVLAECVITDILLAFLLDPLWTWLVFLVNVYAALWLGGLLASQRSHPHRFTARRLLLRDSVFTELAVEYHVITAVRAIDAPGGGRSGYQVSEDGAARMSWGGATVRLELQAAGAVLSRDGFGEQRIVDILDISVDDVAGFCAELAGRAPHLR